MHLFQRCLGQQVGYQNGTFGILESFVITIHFDVLPRSSLEVFHCRRTIEGISHVMQPNWMDRRSNNRSAPPLPPNSILTYLLHILISSSLRMYSPRMTSKVQKIHFIAIMKSQPITTVSRPTRPSKKENREAWDT